MKSYATLDKICFTKKKEFSQNTNAKVFEINELTNYLLTSALNKLMCKYRPEKNYKSQCGIDNELISQYRGYQIYLNPYMQVIKILKYFKQTLAKLRVIGIYENRINCKYFLEYDFNLYSYLHQSYYQHLVKIYSYRNNIYFDNFEIDNKTVKVDEMDPKFLEDIYYLPRNKFFYNHGRNCKEELNMDLEHPYFDDYVYNTKMFYIYLMEFQMTLSIETIQLCWNYIYNYVIDYTSKYYNKINSRKGLKINLDEDLKKLIGEKKEDSNVNDNEIINTDRNEISNENFGENVGENVGENSKKDSNENQSENLKKDSNENQNENLKKDSDENFSETIKINQDETKTESNVHKNEILEKESNVNTVEISKKDSNEIQNSEIKKTKPQIRVTYYLNNFNKHYNVFYGETKEKNRITYMKSFSEYQDQNRCEYYFNHRISLDKVGYTNKTTIEDIFESVKKYFGCILNFGNKKHFEPVYMDFIDDYKILLKIIK